MSTYEEMQILLTFALLVVAILNLKISKPPCPGKDRRLTRLNISPGG